MSRARISLPTGEQHAWVITRYADVRAVLDDDRFASSPKHASSPEHPNNAEHDCPAGPGQLPFLDPPEHSRLRNLLSRALTVQRVNGMRPRIEEIIGRHLDAMGKAGPPCDLVESFAKPVPLPILLELLGIPEQKRDELANTDDFNALLGEFVAAHRTEGLLSVLAPEFTDDELRGIAGLLISSGQATTSAMLGLGTLLLLRNPAQLAAVRDESASVGPAVEELLRYLSVVHFGVPRRAVKDVRLHGRVIKAGDRVICVLPSANRDDELTADDPDRFDITRRPTPHLAFGHGAHQCLGQHLARLIMRTAFPALLNRFPGLRLSVPAEKVRFRTSTAVHELAELPVAW